MNIALIPAKGHSRRIPNKNFMDFCGKPLFKWSYFQALESRLIDKVCISTDESNRIANAMLPLVAGAMPKTELLSRPAHLCTDTTTQEEVIAHAIEALQLEDDDNIVLLQPTSPLRLPWDIDNMLSQSGKFMGRVTMSVTKEDDLFLWNTGDMHKPVTFDIHNRKLLGNFYRENGSIYNINVGSFKLTRSRYGDYDVGNIYEMHKWQQFEIDEPEDIPIVEFFMRKYIIKEI